MLMKLENALIVPGFNESENKYYRQLEKWFHDAGIAPKFVPIMWPRTVLTQNIEEFRKTYVHFNPDTTVIFGYSLGATIAFLAAAERSPAVLILASMAPWFAEDIPNRSKYHRQVVGKRRLDTYKTIRFADTVKSISSKTYLLVGEIEANRWPAFLTRAAAARDLISNSELLEVPRSEHSLNQQYLEKISKIISEL